LTKQIDALADPIIVLDPGWDTPEWLLGEIKLQRLAQLGENGIATDAETLAYVSNASLCGPLGSDWTDVYMYLFSKVMPQVNKEVPEELKKETLSDYQMDLLRRLKEWLWRQRVKAREERARTERAKAKAEAEHAIAKVKGALATAIAKTVKDAKLELAVLDGKSLKMTVTEGKLDIEMVVTKAKTNGNGR